MSGKRPYNRTLNRMSVSHRQPRACPRCGNPDLGQIGDHEYYCEACAVEVRWLRDGSFRVYKIDSDGMLKLVELQPHNHTSTLGRTTHAVD